MSEVIIISASACAAFILLVFFKPCVNFRGKKLSIYWLAPLLAAILLVVRGLLGTAEVFDGLTADTKINPIKILILFLSVTLISIFLDCAGFFGYLASKVIATAKTSQKRLFLYLYLTVSILTVFTSNDIIVLTFTPFICCFAKNARINPIPYLMCEFIAANTWSMALVIGNPTNIYLMTAADISFLEYASVMALPTAAAGMVSFAVLRLIYAKSLSEPLKTGSENAIIADKGSVILGVVHLSVCLVLMVVSNYAGIPMWLIAFVCLISLAVSASVHLTVTKRSFAILKECLRRAPWEIVPFVISMFIIVLALEKHGVTDSVSALLNENNRVLTYGVASFISANLVNNIPMSVLFSSLSGDNTSALYASVVGSNLGAFLTPVGALAGIMWMRMLKESQVRLSFSKFTAYGTAVAVPAMAAALISLIIEL